MITVIKECPKCTIYIKSFLLHGKTFSVAHGEEKSKHFKTCLFKLFRFVKLNRGLKIEFAVVFFKYVIKDFTLLSF